MDTIDKQIFDLLDSCGATRLPRNKHNKYRLPDGQVFVMASSTSDHRAMRNNLAELKRYLGLSKQGLAPRVGHERERYKPGNQDNSPTTYLPPASPINKRFGELIREAMQPPKPTYTAPELPQPAPPPQPKRIRYAKEKSGTHGSVRFWSREQIQAANLAMSQGQLDQFLKEHTQATAPAVPIQPTEEDDTMLTVEQIDSSITELDQGMGIELTKQKAMDQTMERLKNELAHTEKLRLDSVDRYNSLNDVKTNLSVMRDDIARVRPYLASPTAIAAPTTKNGRRTPMKLRDGIKAVLEAAERPLRVGEIHERLTKIPAFAAAEKQGVQNFFTLDRTRNGSAISMRIPGNNPQHMAYWRAGRDLPRQMASA
jgi:hypothetical protein